VGFLAGSASSPPKGCGALWPERYQ
jgi:hypothetical protein